MVMDAAAAAAAAEEEAWAGLGSEAALPDNVFLCSGRHYSLHQKDIQLENTFQD
ncbi:MAG: hypothetical protein IH987_00835 [Planctomycetes bacterium]|nr:hypothetical protein [Planctomycetota bacterium]